MSTVTYSEPAVDHAIDQRFVPLQIDVTQSASQPLIERFHQAWTPDLRVLGADGFEYYRWNGYLPPFEFLPQLLVAQAQACLRSHDDSGAAAVFDDVLLRFPTSHVAAEAQYWSAVARYKQNHAGSDLMSGWHRLQSRYPESIWRVKQAFAEKPASNTA
ncbi:MAG TPA: thioredoxin [Chloroflexota bacterium]|nr:thioredoxin [Chloroflexota bacterium]